MLHKVVRSVFSQNPTTVRWALRNIVHDPRALPDHLVQELRRLLRQPRAGRAFILWQRDEIMWKGLRSDFTARLGEIGARTLIIHGAQDRLIPVSSVQKAHCLIKGSELHVFDRCGHWPPHEKTREFNRLAVSFLAGQHPFS